MKKFLTLLLFCLSTPIFSQVYKSGYVSLYNQINSDWVHIQSEYQNHSFTITSTKIYWQTPEKVVYYKIKSVKELENSTRGGLIYTVSGENNEVLIIAVTPVKISLMYFDTEIPFALVFKLLDRL